MEADTGTGDCFFNEIPDAGRQIYNSYNEKIAPYIQQDDNPLAQIGRYILSTLIELQCTRLHFAHRLHKLFSIFIRLDSLFNGPRAYAVRKYNKRHMVHI